MNRAARDLGRLGEGVLRQWAAQVGIVLNPASHDAAGWDFLLEWPLTPPGPHAPFALDRQPPPRQVLVQVKSSDGTPRSWPVKLDNWLRLVSSPLPAFFLLLHFDGGDTCVRAELAHVSKSLMSRVLKRLRELSTEKGTTRALHKHRLGLRAADAATLPSPNATSFEDAVQQAVGSDISAYTATKLRLRETLGYEEATAQANLKILIPTEYQAAGGAEDVLVDLALGLLRDVEIAGGDLTNVRFGIAAPAPDWVFPSGSRLGLTSHTPAAVGRLILSDSMGRQADIPVDVHVPAGVGHLVDRSRLKMRLAGQYFDFVWAPWGARRCVLTLRPPADTEAVPIESYTSAAAIIRAVGEAVAGRDHALEIEIAGQVVSKGALDGFEALPRVFHDWADATDNAMKVAAHFRVSRDVLISPSDLLRDRSAFRWLRAILAQDGRTFSVSFGLDQAPDDPALPWCIPGVTEVRMGRHHIQVAWGLFGMGGPSGESDGGKQRFELVTNDARVLGSQLTSGSDRPPVPADVLRAELVARFESDHSVFTLG